MLSAVILASFFSCRCALVKLPPLSRSGFALMSDWTEAETRELVRLWPKASAKQIAERLGRPRAAITGKASRLVRDGVLPPGRAKRFAANAETSPHGGALSLPHGTANQPLHVKHPNNALAKSMDTANTLTMRPCALAELDDGHCRWPLAETTEVAVLFCGGDAVPGRRYCSHHLRLAARSGRF